MDTVLRMAAAITIAAGTAMSALAVEPAPYTDFEPRVACFDIIYRLTDSK